MTEKQYNFKKNLRLVGLTGTVILIIILAFQLFKDKQVDALNIVSILVLVINGIYFVINTPTPPTNEQTIRETPETKQN